MSFDRWAAQRDLGLLLHVPGVASIIPGVVAAARSEIPSLIGFGITLVLALGLGQALIHTARRPTEGRSALSMPTAAIAWLACAFVASIPFLATGLAAHPDETSAAFAFYPAALFEGMSGITSTGLSMATDPSTLPASIQLWRSLLEWIGGLGLVLVAVALFDPASDPYALYSAEARSRSFGEDLRGTLHCIWVSYVALTILAVLSLRITGWGWWVALNHGITAISTGGFTITSDGYVGAPAGAKAAALIFMTLGAVGFNVHDSVRRGHLGILLRDVQIRMLAAGLLVGSALMLGLVSRGSEADVDSWDAVFNWVSASTTCGFSAVDVNAMGDGAIVLMIMGMLAGGAAGSTAGGLKLKRVAVLTRSVFLRIRFELEQRPSVPERSSEAEREEREREAEEMEEEIEEEEREHREEHEDEDAGQLEPASAEFRTAGILLLLFLGALSLGTLALLASLGDQFTLGQCLFEATSALCSVGLSTGVTSPDLPWTATTTLTLLMWVGRLEILAVIALVATVIARR